MFEFATNPRRNKNIILFICASAYIFALLGYVGIALLDISQKNADIQDLTVIRECIHSTNEAIKSAIIAPDADAKRFELQKRFDNRKIVDAAVANFIARGNHSEQTHRLFKQMIEERNGTYRIAQNSLIALIEANASDAVIWREMANYQTHREKYKSYIDEMLSDINQRVQSNYKIMLYIVIVFVLVVVALANIMASHMVKHHREVGDSNDQ